jgi:3-oxoacyl-[acyl-carrier protein] reductase
MIDVDLRGRVALVTGGSRGIGRSTATALAKAGARIAIGYRTNATAAAETVASIHAGGGEAISVAADVGTEGGCAELHRSVVRELGKVDILVNNVGAAENELFMLLKDDSFERMFAANLMSTVRLCRLAANHMMAQKWGRIINVSSIAATRPTAGQSNYSVAKAGVEALTRSLAIEMHKRNVNVNCIAPGLIDTDMGKGADASLVLSHQLVKRLGQPEEIAGWIVMLASRFGDYVTGQVFRIDGGYMLV